MDFKNIAVSMLAKKMGLDPSMAGGIIDKLVGGGDKMDVAGLVGNLKEKGLGDVADSWLGDGENKEISPEQLKEALGADQISAAAAEMGTDEGSLLAGLQSALPQMVDKASSGGNLLDKVGGLGGLAGMAKKFL